MTGGVPDLDRSQRSVEDYAEMIEEGYHPAAILTAIDRINTNWSASAYWHKEADKVLLASASVCWNESVIDAFRNIEPRWYE